MYNYGLVIIASWFTFLIVWVISSLFAKRDVQQRSFSGFFGFWFWRILLIAFIILLIESGGKQDLADVVIFRSGPVLGWIGAALTVIGVAFAIWARYYLGRNWSSHPTQKEKGHELVTGGPYAFVRHPIYTGMLLAVIGSALTGSIFSIILVVVLTIMFLLRIVKEEFIMLTLFPDTYPAYQARTKKLIPFIW